MNYFEHHIGDYDEATSHLTPCQDGIYHRLLRKYYAKEKALPADIEQLQIWTRCRTKEDRAAVVSVLKEFFILEEDGYHQKVCDATLEKFLAGEPEREVKKANENNRMARHRAERAELFKIITDAGDHMPWNTPTPDLRKRAEYLKSVPDDALPATPPVTPPVTQPVTAPATPATATQTPDTNNQSPVLKQQGLDTHLNPSVCVSPGEISKVMRSFSIMSNPSDPRLVALADSDINIETVRSACQTAREAKPDQRIPPAYVISILENWAERAKTMQVNGAKAPSANKQDGRAAAAASIGLGAKQHVEHVINPRD